MSNQWFSAGRTPPDTRTRSAHIASKVFAFRYIKPPTSGFAVERKATAHFRFNNLGHRAQPLLSVSSHAVAAKALSANPGRINALVVQTHGHCSCPATSSARAG